ncbi:TetR/AcrR family transcriptional regulator [Actinophytocola sp.]|uniref:TetR/AcrR family transcriptional regulator n=1 Tax=Actinophytocola sp. TaxID=1872138 RepID=UPI00389AE493
MRTYGGASPAERRAKRRAALCEAALGLLAEGGWERVTVRGVCTRARLNDRYFYESFRDPEALVLAVREQVTAQVFETVTETIRNTEPDPDVRVRAVVAAVIDFFTVDPRRGHLLLQSQATDELRRARQATVRVMARLVAEQGVVMLGDEAPPERDRELAALTLVHGTLELFASWLRGELDVTREHLTDFLVAMVRTTGGLR